MDKALRGRMNENRENEWCEQVVCAISISFDLLHLLFDSYIYLSPSFELLMYQFFRYIKQEFCDFEIFFKSLFTPHIHHNCFLTCCNSNGFSWDGHVLAHMIMCSHIDGVHLATDHVIHRTVSVVGGARDCQTLLCHPLDCVVFSTRGAVPLHQPNGQAVLGSDVHRDAWLWKTQTSL